MHRWGKRRGKVCKMIQNYVIGCINDLRRSFLGVVAHEDLCRSFLRVVIIEVAALKCRPERGEFLRIALLGRWCEDSSERKPCGATIPGRQRSREKVRVMWHITGSRWCDVMWYSELKPLESLWSTPLFLRYRKLWGGWWRGEGGLNQLLGGRMRSSDFECENNFQS